MKTFNLRLPDEVYAMLAALAGQDRRSLNAEVVSLVEQEAARRATEG